MPITNLEELGRFLDLEEGQKLTDLLKSEDEVEIKIKQGEFFDEEKKETLIVNHRKEAETAGREKLLKELRDSNGLTYEGVKHPEKLIEAITEKVRVSTLEEANLEPNKKIDSLTSDLNSLRGQLEEKDNMLTDLNNKIKLEQQNMKIEQSIIKSLPESTILPKDDLVLLFKNKHELTLDENGNILTMKNGEVVKDELRNPVSIDKIVSEFSSNYIKTPDGGSGQSRSSGTSSGDMDSFIEEMKSKEIALNSEEFNVEMMRRIDAGTLKG